MNKKSTFFRKNKKNDYNIKLEKKKKDNLKVVNKKIEPKDSIFKKYSTIVFSMLLVVVFIVVLGSSYAYFSTTIKGKEFVIYTGNLAVDYAKKTNVISLDNLYPMTDSEGLTLTAHEFSVTNSGNIDARYQIRLEIDNSSKDSIPIEYIKLSYKQNDGEYTTPVLLSTLNSSLVFVSDVVINPTESDNYGIKLWIDLSAPNDIQGKTFKARVVVDSIQNVDDGYVVDTVPVITLNKDSKGNTDIHLKTGETYNELGVKDVKDDKQIFTANDVSLSYEYYDGSNLSTVSSVDTSKNGIYYVTYSITDKDNNTAKAIRVVTVNNSDSIPSITLNGNSEITLGENDEYIELGATIADGNKLVKLGEVKTSVIGTYAVRYIVVDSNNNLNSIIRTINVNKTTTLSNKLFAYNSLVPSEPTLTDSSNNTNDASGLYKSTATNDGSPTYYFRGNVENNYVEFAGLTWRIVRINEDGTIRLVMQDGINDNATYRFNSTYSSKDNMYYSNSDTTKPTLEAWYTENIVNKGYSDKVVTGNYYCEQAKVAIDSSYATNSGADMIVHSNYTNPNFKCIADVNEHGFLNTNIGLLSYDEVLHAGGYYGRENSDYYLYNETAYWTMSPAGFSGSKASVWRVNDTGYISSSNVNPTYRLRPVINLKADTVASGTGTSNNPYVVGEKLSDLILDGNDLIEAAPTLTDSSNNTNDASGLYKSTATNSGDPTYYFRGNVENNYVEFAGFTWRIVRINEDGTVRIVMQDGINNNTGYIYNSVNDSKDSMYYTNSNVKSELESWYTTNIVNKGFSVKVSTGNYYCEQAKVAQNDIRAVGSGADMKLYSDYVPNFKCATDANGYGIINSNIGLLTYDESNYAGSYNYRNNDSYYLYNNNAYWWTMSPAGYSDAVATIWYLAHTGFNDHHYVYKEFALRPVINLKAGTVVSGLGTSSQPYKVIY